MSLAHTLHETDIVTLVSGLPRSGTSLMMQMLQRAGIEPLTDGVRLADDDNPRGYLELEAVKRIAEGAPWLDDARGRAVKLISQLLLEVPRGHRYRVIFMRRRLDEVLRSQRRMLGRRGERDELARDDAAVKEHFVAHLEDVERFLQARDDIDVLFVSYNRLLAAPAAQTRRIADFLQRSGGPTVDATSLAAAIEPTLYRNREP